MINQQWQSSSNSLSGGDKYPDPSKIPLFGGGPDFGYPQREFALLEVHGFIEIPNIKLQISNNFQ